MTILTAIRDAFRVDEQTTIDDYRGLVVAATDDKPIDDSVAVGILNRSQKTADDLDADVDLLRQRRQWATEIREAEEADDLIAQKQNEVAELRAERERVVSPINDTINATLAEIEELRRVTGRAGRHPSRLLESAPAALKARRDEVIRERSAVQKRRDQLAQHCRHIEFDIENIELELADDELPDHQRGEIKQSLKHQRGELTNARSTLTEVDEQLAVLNDTAEAIHADMLKP